MGCPSESTARGSLAQWLAAPTPSSATLTAPTPTAAPVRLSSKSIRPDRKSRRRVFQWGGTVTITWPRECTSGGCWRSPLLPSSRIWGLGKRRKLGTWCSWRSVGCASSLVFSRYVPLAGLDLPLKELNRIRLVSWHHILLCYCLLSIDILWSCIVNFLLRWKFFKF